MMNRIDKEIEIKLVFNEKHPFRWSNIIDRFLNLMLCIRNSQVLTASIGRIFKVALLDTSQ